LPYEDIDSFQKTFDLAYALGAKELQLGFLKLLRGTSLRKNALQYGYVYNPQPPYEITESSWLSSEDIGIIRNVEQALNVYWNKNFMTETMTKISRIVPSMFDFFRSLFDYYRQYGYDFHCYQLKDVFERLNDFLATRYPDIHKDVFPIIKKDYLSRHRIKPEIWWKDTREVRKRLMNIILETDSSFSPDYLRKYGVATDCGGEILLVMYLPDNTVVRTYGK